MLTEKEYKSRLKKSNPRVIMLGHYFGMHNKTKFKCKECGYVWEAAPYHIIGGQGCKKCGYKRVSKALSMTNRDFVQRLKEMHPEIKPLEEYQGSHNKIKCECKICKNIWYPTPHDLLAKKSTGCPICALKKLSKRFSKTNEQFIKELNELTKDIIPLEKYTNNKTKMRFLCKRCNHEWKTTPNAILRNTLCPMCTKSGTSYVEQFILLALKNIIGEKDVLSRKRNIISKELDIYIPKYKFAIEYGSWYWHKERLQIDQEKFEICRKNGIKLVRIYDACQSDNKDTKYVWYYKEYLGERIDNIILVVFKILKILNIKYNAKSLKEELKYLSNSASNKSLKMGEKELIDKIKIISPNIEIISKFLGRKCKIKCKCKICNNIWETTPQSLLAGRGCKKCGYKKTAQKLTKNHEWFSDQFNKKNKNAKYIIFLSKYRKSTEKIKCKCLKCNYIWNTTPHMLLQNHGCPNCY